MHRMVFSRVFRQYGVIESFHYFCESPVSRLSSHSNVGRRFMLMILSITKEYQALCHVFSNLDSRTPLWMAHGSLGKKLFNT